MKLPFLREIINNIHTATNVRIRNVVIYVLVFLVLWIVTNVQLASIVISLGLVYTLLKHYLSATIFNTVVFRFVASGVFYVSFLQCIVLISWLLSKDFPLDKTPFVGLIGLIVILAVQYFFSASRRNAQQATPPKKVIPFLALADIVSLALASVFIGFAILAPTFHTGGLNKSSFVGLISDGVDDSAHLGILNDRVQLNKGVMLGTSNLDQTRFVAITFYPAGWHSANVALIKAINPNVVAGSQTLIIYGLLKVFWYFILLLVFTRSVFSVYTVLSNKRTSFEIYVLIAILSLVFYYLFLLHPFREGFFSYFPQLIATPFFVLGLIEMATAKKNEKSFFKPLPFIAMMAAGGVLSWLLILPVFVAGIILSILDRIRKTSTRSFLTELTTSLPTYAPVYLLIIAAILTQLYVASASKDGVSFIAGILQGGGIAVYDSLFYLFVLAGIGILFACIKKGSAPQLKSIVNYLVVAILFAAFLFCLQLYNIQENRYYFYKTLNAFTIVAIIVAIAGYAHAVDWISKHKSRGLAVIVAIVLPTSALLFIPSDNTNAGYIAGQRFVHYSVNASIYNELAQNATQSKYNQRNYVLYYLPGAEQQNDISTMLIKSNKPQSACLMGLRSIMKETPIEQFDTNILQQFRDSCLRESTTITYAVTAEYVTGMQQKIRDASLDEFIKVKAV